MACHQYYIFFDCLIIFVNFLYMFLLFQFSSPTPLFILPTTDNAFVVLDRPLDYEAMVASGATSIPVYSMNITATVRSPQCRSRLTHK